MRAIIAATLILILSPFGLLMAALVWAARGPADAMDWFSRFCLNIYVFVCEVFVDEQE